MKHLVKVNAMLAVLLMILLAAPTSFAAIHGDGGAPGAPGGDSSNYLGIGKKEYPNYPTPPGEATAPDKVRVRAPAAPDPPPRNAPSEVKVKAPPAPDTPPPRRGPASPPSAAEKKMANPPQTQAGPPVKSSQAPAAAVTPPPSAPKAVPPPPTPVKVKEPPRRPGT